MWQTGLSGLFSMSNPSQFYDGVATIGASAAQVIELIKLKVGGLIPGSTIHVGYKEKNRKPLLNVMSYI